MENQNPFNEQNRNECSRLDEYEFIYLKAKIDLLKEDIERIATLLYVRTRLKNTRLENSEQEFWNRLNETREVDKKDILGYAQLKEDLNSLAIYKEYIGIVCNDSLKMLDEIENLIKQLL